MLKKILIGVVVVIALLVVIGFLLPGQVHVERSVTINADAQAVWGHIASFEKFNEWSPWAKRDPNTKYTFEGPKEGVGSKMSWVSDHPNVGSGSQEVSVFEPGKRHVTKLDFGDQGTAEAFFNLDKAEGGTKVTWGFDTDLGMNPIARYMGLMFDSWVGADYEAGLDNLKRLAEGGAKG